MAKPKGQTLRTLPAILITVALLTSLAGVWWLLFRWSGPIPKAQTPLHLVQTQMRHIMQALVVYSQNYQDRWPAAGPDWHKPLINLGLVTPDMLVHPDPKFAGLFLCGYIPPPAGNSAITPEAPILIENPAAVTELGCILFMDGHVESLPREKFDRLLATAWAGRSTSR